MLKQRKDAARRLEQLVREEEDGRWKREAEVERERAAKEKEATGEAEREARAAREAAGRVLPALKKEAEKAKRGAEKATVEKMMVEYGVQQVPTMLSPHVAVADPLTA